MFAKATLAFSAAAVLVGPSPALSMVKSSVRVGASAALAQSVSAQNLRRNRVPAFAPGFRQTPMFAPDAPTPQSYSNPGRPDFQNGSRG
jgi:hypothetical protein